MNFFLGFYDLINEDLVKVVTESQSWGKY
jgi:hypothetical protein